MTCVVICPNCLESREYFARLSVARTNRTLFCVQLAQSHTKFRSVGGSIDPLAQTLFLLFVLLYIEIYIFDAFLLLILLFFVLYYTIFNIILF